MIMKGQKISDRYQIIKSIGEGGMANVYLAYDTILDRNVAVKILRGELSSDEKFVRRFQREALSASSLSNPNIVEVYDVGEDNGDFYIVMEYIEGKHLKALLKKRGKLTVPEVVDIMSQIANGLSVAHDSYIIHRDIKPQNIMILENGMVKITDFGIAMAINATQLTQTNSVMGSVHYLPPEQASGKGATLQSDIYSMGILMYELLTGNLPFKGDNAIEIALKHLKEHVPPVSEELPNVPQSIENIIIRATAKNPKNRYADAREMYEDLKTCLDASRKNEPKYTYKYPESDYDDTKVLKLANSKKNDDKKDNKETEEKEQIAKKITADDMKGQNKVLIVLASIFTGIVVLATVLFVLFFKVLPGMNAKNSMIPDVKGLTVEAAVEKLQKKGFTVSDEQKEISSTEIDEGLVVKTNPAAGASRKKSTEVTLFISAGDAKVEIEDYKGKNYLEVKGALEALKINVLIEKTDVDEETDYDENEIVSQSKEPGEKLSVGETITLYIPKIESKYPDFTKGFTVDDVRDFAETHKLKVDVEEVISEDYAEGTIFYQSRPEGYTIIPDTSFKIKVAVAPAVEDIEENELD